MDTVFDEGAGGSDEEGAGVSAEEGHGGDGLGGVWGAGIFLGGEEVPGDGSVPGPEELALAVAAVAGGGDEGLGFGFAEESGDAVHAGLAAKHFFEVAGGDLAVGEAEPVG